VIGKKALLPNHSFSGRKGIGMKLKFQPGGEKSKGQKKSGKTLIPDLESTGCSGRIVHVL